MATSIAPVGTPAAPLGQSIRTNARAELTSSAREVMSWTYEYDPIGNCRQHTADPNTGEPDLCVRGMLSRLRAGMLIRSIAKAWHAPARRATA